MVFIKQLFECEICFEKKRHFLKCQRCKKGICHHCIIDYTKSFNNLLDEYSCPYCRYRPTIKEHIIFLEKLNEILENMDSLFHIKIKVKLFIAVPLRFISEN